MGIDLGCAPRRGRSRSSAQSGIGQEHVCCTCSAVSINQPPGRSNWKESGSPENERNAVSAGQLAQRISGFHLSVSSLAAGIHCGWKTSRLPLFIRRPAAREGVAAGPCDSGQGWIDRARRPHMPGEPVRWRTPSASQFRACAGHSADMRAGRTEPTGNLDHTTALQVFDLLLELKPGRFAASLVIVTHDLELAARRGPRCCASSDGRAGAVHSDGPV